MPHSSSPLPRSLHALTGGRAREGLSLRGGQNNLVPERVIFYFSMSDRRSRSRARRSGFQDGDPQLSGLRKPMSETGGRCKCMDALSRYRLPTCCSKEGSLYPVWMSSISQPQNPSFLKLQPDAVLFTPSWGSLRRKKILRDRLLFFTNILQD